MKSIANYQKIARPSAQNESTNSKNYYKLPCVLKSDMMKHFHFSYQKSVGLTDAKLVLSAQNQGLGLGTNKHFCENCEASLNKNSLR